MLYAQSPATWTALLWKDFRQVRSLFAIICGALLCTQLLFVSARLGWFNDTMVEAAIGITMVTPLVGIWIVIIACSGMLIGHERETNTWLWNSSMPLSSAQALTSKVLLTLGMAVGCAALLSPGGWAAWIASGTVRPPGWMFLAVASIAVQSVILFFILCLCMRETLHALILGIFLQGIFAGMSLSVWRSVSTGICVSLVITFAFLWILHAVHQWRWQQGQYGSFMVMLQEFGKSIFSPAGHAPFSAAQPSETKMIARLAIRCIWPVWLISLVMIALPLTAKFGDAYALRSIRPICLGFLCVFLGVCAFAPHQVRGRLRFLSDRGVSPARHIGIHLLMAGVFTSITCVIEMSFREWPVQWAECVYLAGLFLLGVIAGSSFRKPIVAVTAAISSGCIALICITQFTSFHGLAFRDVFGWTELEYALPFGCSALFILLPSIVLIQRNQLRFDQPSSGWQFFAATGAAITLPIISMWLYSLWMA